MTIVYKASSLITVLDTLSKLKAKLKTKTESTKITSSEEEDEATNIFMLTLVELDDDLSRSISEGISQDPRLEKIYQVLKDST